MRIGMIGLGAMGGNMTERLIREGHEVVVFDRNGETVAKYAAAGAIGAGSAVEVVATLESPRIVWIMVPAGAPVDATIETLAPAMESGDVIVDGGNSNFHDTMQRAEMLSEEGIEYVDCGTSGGIWGLENGYCLMVGGSEKAFAICEPVFKSLAPENGYAHMGPSGAGHYVKMIHNGIEYGMLQAYAEGYEMLHASKHFDLDLHRIAGVWNHGSVVRSWINELAERAFGDKGNVESLKGFVADSGTGRWTVQEA
ncbi:MAG: phosphogluconate dehydrogenase (NAD(+)-dependent, decarboxylating), partial [Gemmatimonadaceae bacterium]